MSEAKKSISHVRRYLVTGILTIIPLWITWLVIEFLFSQLAKFGMPWIWTFSKAIRQESPFFANLLLATWFESLLAVLVTLVGLYLLGWAATRMVGMRLLRAFDALIARLPLIQTIYGSTKKLIAVLQQEPENLQRVVLIEFPSPGMKVVGFATRTLIDADTGETLVVVYVPTAPNPTSGYLEIVPLAKVTPTDWTVDEALNFTISGGAVAPEKLRYHGHPIAGKEGFS